MTGAEALGIIAFVLIFGNLFIMQNAVRTNTKLEREKHEERTRELIKERQREQELKELQ